MGSVMALLYRPLLSSYKLSVVAICLSLIDLPQFALQGFTWGFVGPLADIVLSGNLFLLLLLLRLRFSGFFPLTLLTSSFSGLLVVQAYDSHFLMFAECSYLQKFAYLRP